VNDFLKSRSPDKIILFAGLALALLASIVVFSGCEDNAVPREQTPAPPPSALSINPSVATLNSSNTYAMLVASGGAPPYKWSISDPSLGAIPETGAGAITYTAVAAKQGVNVLSVVDQNNWTAQAFICQE